MVTGFPGIKKAAVKNGQIWLTVKEPVRAHIISVLIKAIRINPALEVVLGRDSYRNTDFQLCLELRVFQCNAASHLNWKDYTQQDPGLPIEWSA
jgi:hypothetical protein